MRSFRWCAVCFYREDNWKFSCRAWWFPRNHFQTEARNSRSHQWVCLTRGRDWWCSVDERTPTAHKLSHNRSKVWSYSKTDFHLLRALKWLSRPAPSLLLLWSAYLSRISRSSGSRSSERHKQPKAQSQGCRTLDTCRWSSLRWYQDQSWIILFINLNRPRQFSYQGPWVTPAMSQAHFQSRGSFVELWTPRRLWCGGLLCQLCSSSRTPSLLLSQPLQTPQSESKQHPSLPSTGHDQELHSIFDHLLFLLILALRSGPAFLRPLTQTVSLQT